VTQLQFDLSTVAAILTIVGYSLNDTVVIYDRVRENLRRFKKMPLGQLLDLSDNEMLARTTMTSVTTFLALLALFLLGGEVIRSFVASMLFGVFIGTFSSIFIAAPILILFHLRPASKEAMDAAEHTPQLAAKAQRASSYVRPITRAVRRSRPMAMGASASRICRIVARFFACLRASTAGSRAMRTHSRWRISRRSLLEPIRSKSCWWARARTSVRFPPTCVPR